MTAVERNSPWKRPSRWVPLALIALAILTFAAFRMALNSGVKRQVDALRSKGLPVSPMEADKWYEHAPATENAALAFLDAHQLYVAPGADDPSEMNKHEMVLGAPLPPELEAAVQNLVSENRETIAQLHKAAELKKSRYPIDLTKGFSTLLPHLANLRTLTQLLKWEAIEQSAKGNRAEALKAVHSGLAVAQSLENEPLLISELVRLAIVSLMMPALERVVTEQTLTDAELIGLMVELDRLENQGRISMRRAMAGERAMGVAAFKTDFRTLDQLGAGSTAGGVGALPDFFKLGLLGMRRALGMSDKDQAFYLESIGKLEAALNLEDPEMLRETKVIDASIMNELEEKRVRYMISGMILPSMQKGLEREVILRAQLRCTRLALAIERYRLKHGKLPTLDDLVPEYLTEMPRDPVSGDMLEYEKLEGGYRISSWEATELKTNKGRKRNQEDVAFTVRR